jgi:hypothetical protein
MNEEELGEVIGVVAMREYHGATENEQAQIRSWLPRLRAMGDSEFIREATYRIEWSARENNSRNAEGVHCMATVCYVEAKRRYTEAGHSDTCLGTNLYGTAHARAMRNHGHTPSDPYPCTCGKEKS